MVVGAARSHPGIRERREKRERAGGGRGKREREVEEGGRWKRRRKKVGGAAAGIAGAEREGCDKRIGTRVARWEA